MSEETQSEEIQDAEAQEALDSSADEAPGKEQAEATSDSAASAPDPTRSRRKVREGLVISAKMNQTLVVGVDDRVRHRRYKKTVRTTKKLYVHDADNAAKEGDRVRVMETRPLSKLKRWRLVEIVERAR